MSVAVTELIHETSMSTRTAQIAMTAVFFGGNLGAGFAPLDSPQFTGTPTVPTAPAGDESELIANTEFVQGELDDLIVDSRYF